VLQGRRSLLACGQIWQRTSIAHSRISSRNRLWIERSPTLYPNEDPYQPVNILCYREGPRMRIMGVFVYEYQPGIKGDPEVNETIYGSRVIAR